MPLIATAINLAERLPLPDSVTLSGIDFLVGRTRRRLEHAPFEDEARFVDEMEAYPVAVHTDKANSQHYELPPEFFARVLGPARKYSCCLYPSADSSLAEAERHFRGKALFRHFAPEALRDYVRYGLADDGERLRLMIDPGIEYQIYRTIPHDLNRLLPKLRVPAGFIGGADSDIVRRVGLSTMRRAGFAFRRVPGGHLFPLEQPQAAAEAILEMTAKLAG